MKAIALILILLSSVYHDVAKSDDGVLQASLTENGETFILSVKSSNQMKADSLVLCTTNSWSIKLFDNKSLDLIEGNFVINAVQKSILLEEEILLFKVYQSGHLYEYRATDRSFFKNRMKK